ncbi:MAG: HAD family hydrolase, partial [Planctomycetota bacterium]
MMSLVSFDIWDTLLRRRCAPDEVKLFTARAALLGYARQLRQPTETAWTLLDARQRIEGEIAAHTRADMGGDDEYEILDVLQHWLDRHFRFGSQRRCEEAAASLAELEIEQEIAVTYADPLGCALAVSPPGAAPGLGVVAISDFYMTEPRLRRIIASALPDTHFQRVFVSCDERINKRSGRLFSLVQRECNATPREHLHIGNSIASDVTPARKLGARAIHFKNPPLDAVFDEQERCFNLRRAHARKAPCKQGLVARPAARANKLEKPATLNRALSELQGEITLACTPPADYDARQSALFRAGARFAPVIAGLVLHAAECAHRRGLDRVFYCTREGTFFEAMHRALAPHRPFGIPMPQSQILHVSRISTFMPSLRRFDTDEMMRVWRMYSKQSIGQMLASMHVESLPFEPMIARHGLTPDEVIVHPWKDVRVRALFEDRAFVTLLERRRTERRKLLYPYFDSRGFSPARRSVVIVDIGWRGTIVDNIAHLFPKTRVHGVFLGLFNLLNDQPTNASKSAFGPDARTSTLPELATITHVAPLEMICNSAGGSCMGYARDEQGRMAAQTLESAGESRVHHESVQYFQSGALAAAATIAQWVRRHAVSTDELKPHALQLLREFMNRPTPELAEAYFNLSHNETFGNAAFFDKALNVSEDVIDRGMRTHAGWRALVAEAERSTWPQGMFVALGLGHELERYIAERDRVHGGRSPNAQIEAKAAA